MSAGNYTAWEIRKKCIVELNKDLEEEFIFIENTIESQEKAYQIWEYRKWLVEYSGKYKDEMQFINMILSKDHKNYHAWSYRHQILNKYKLHQQENK